MKWILLHPQMTPEHLGFLPDLLSDYDPRPVREQLATNYAHGGGWRPFGRGMLTLDDLNMVLHYPGDPPLEPLARTKLRDEELYFYSYAILMVRQPDGSFEVTRVD